MRSRLFPLVAIALGLIVVFLGIEVALRLAGPDWLEARMEELNAGERYELGSDQAWPVIEDDGVFRQFAPRSSFMVRNYEYEHEAVIDELGGRETHYPSDHVGIIPFMGDSFTFGIGVQDAETFVSLLAEHTPYRLLNLGVPGSALHNQIDIVDARHLELGSPRAYVFCLFMGNDLADIASRYPPHRIGTEHDVSGRERGLLWQINDVVFHDPILKRIYTIQFVRQKLLTISNRGGTARMNPIFLTMRSDTDYLDETVGYLREELKRLDSMSLHFKFRYVFILIPDVHQISPTRLETKRKYYGLDETTLDPGAVTDAISSALNERHIPYIDISACLGRAGFPDELYFVQDNHFNRSGHQRVFTCLMDNELMELVAQELAIGTISGVDSENGSREAN